MTKQHTFEFKFRDGGAVIKTFRTTHEMEVSVPTMTHGFKVEYVLTKVEIDVIGLSVQFESQIGQIGQSFTFSPFACRDGYVGRAMRLLDDVKRQREALFLLKQITDENYVSILQAAEKLAQRQVGKNKSKPRSEQMHKTAYEKRLARAKPQPQIKLPWDNI